ncbi:LexA/Signal peptidase [Eremomyces bilateralis CBS 781.70]|uniref:Mitochondrial inner membrane protease subunit 2 n=1 Tax=Eremomyces bilateralis CBS 781.70 TaxID=1392243 RepID=A0A6G1G0H6_9PEZI|nr:LexA/Signal peptidase [Eremomyces bilateralis CBS 781.70]KAF1811554.1 LexA/Signal peptidase [Eremomyces bilateralis CBS 781.70]
MQTLRQYARFPYRAGLAFATGILINEKLASPLAIEGSSMHPALSPDYHATGRKDRVVFTKWGAAHDLKRGDVIAFWTPHDPEKIGVKRVVAVAGDTVVPRSDKYPLREEVVPFNHVWVEGDNERDTKDSNDYGPISKALIHGKASYIVWPFVRFGPVESIHAKSQSKIRETPTAMVVPEEYL